MPYLNRYFLFARDAYYPGGGWTDFVGSFCSVKAAKAHVTNNMLDGDYKWWHVVNSTTGEVINT